MADPELEPSFFDSKISRIPLFSMVHRSCSLPGQVRFAGVCARQKLGKEVPRKNSISTKGAFVFVASEQTSPTIKERFSRPGETALNGYLVCFYSSEEQ